MVLRYADGNYWELRAVLDYGEEVHWSRVLGERSNMIGYKMCLHQSGFTLRPKIFWWRISSMDERMTWLPTWQHSFLLGQFSGSQSFWGDLNLSDKKLGLLRTPNCSIFVLFLPSCPPY